jgi:hypothetical protein
LTADPDLFRDGRLGFELRKPAGWQFLPPAWSPLERAKRVLDEEDLRRNAGKPFVCAFRNDRIAQARPTLQATARPCATPPPGQLPAILEMLVDTAVAANRTTQVESRMEPFEISGYAAVGFVCRFHLEPAFGQAQTLGGARTRSYLVFARGLAFSIGLSSSDDRAHYDEAEFAAILASIRIR